MTLSRRMLLKISSAGVILGAGTTSSRRLLGQTGSRKGYALHIGVDRVDRTKYGSSIAYLGGCKNDAQKMHQIAKSQSFHSLPPLIDHDATRNNVARHILWAAEDLNANDTFLVTYAGHGGQLVDTSGDEHDDGRDETWCLYDSQLPDDFLYQMWGKFKPGVRIVVVSDSCHSGTVARAREAMNQVERSIERNEHTNTVLRGLSRGATRGVRGADNSQPGDDVRSQIAIRAISENEAMADYQKNREYYDALDRDMGQGDERSRDYVKASGVLLAGCQDHQVSMESNGQGMFSQALKEVWDGRQQSPVSSYSELLDRATSRLKGQTPNLFRFGAQDTNKEKERLDELALQVSPFTV